jgi:hypothetical protein
MQRSEVAVENAQAALLTSGFVTPGATTMESDDDESKMRPPQKYDKATAHPSFRIIRNSCCSF